MDDLVLDAESLFNIADIIDGYCAKQREVVNVYHAQIMALESEWRDDETFGTMMQELNALRTQAIAILDEVYEVYPKYFRQRAQRILERPIYHNGTVVPTPVSTYMPNTRAGRTLVVEQRGAFISTVGHSSQLASSISGGKSSKAISNGVGIDSSESESFLWFKGKKNGKGVDSGIKKYTTASAKSTVEPSEYKKYHKYYDFLDTLDIPQSFKDKVIKCYRNMDESLKAKYNAYAKQLKCLDSNYVEYDDNGNRLDGAHYSSEKGKQGFKFNWEFDINNPCGECNTFFHESGHMLDDLIGQKMGKEFFASAVTKLSDVAKEDLNDAINRIMLEKGCDRSAAIKEIEKDLRNNESATVQDIYAGASNNEIFVIWDHQSEPQEVFNRNGESVGTLTYWHYTDNQGKMREWRNRIGKEAFANITADIACNNQKSIEYISKYLPKTLAKYKEIIGGVK